MPDWSVPSIGRIGSGTPIDDFDHEEPGESRMGPACHGHRSHRFLPILLRFHRPGHQLPRKKEETHEIFVERTVVSELEASHWLADLGIGIHVDVGLTDFGLLDVVVDLQPDDILERQSIRERAEMLSIYCDL
ncbi:unnamed protein product [Trichogramma brassicae]|uniref:Uncharacterized protein n=1 Tax=Trichogramma brassicae TaxID=86971 RepID=A0A6H5I8H4_9HYME|nr:unnamed protein product [Trichogramma brassicae]